MTKKAYDPAAQETALHEQLKTARAEREGALAQLADGVSVADKIDALDEEIVECERLLKRLAEARTVAKAVKSKGARQAAHASTTAELHAGLIDAAELAAESAKLVEAIDTLQTRVARVAQLRDAVHEKLFAAGRGVANAAPNEPFVLHTFEQLGSAITRLTVPTHLVAAVLRTGLGTAVHISSDFWSVRNPVGLGNDYRDPMPDLTSAMAKLGEIAATFEQWSLVANKLSKEAA